VGISPDRRDSLKALCVFIALTLVMTWPVAARPFWVRVDSEFDIALFWWNLWWVKRAVWNLRTNPFWCSYLMYPHGVSVVFQAPSYIYAFLSIPVQLLFGFERGVPLSTNLVLLGSTILTGWGTWLLARKITGDARAAYIAGCIFAFSPFRFYHTARPHLICTEFLVFYILLFWIALDNKRKSYATAAGLLFAAIVYSSPTYTLYAVWMSVFVAVRFFIINRRDWKKLIPQSAISASIAIILSLPWLFAAMKVIGGSDAVIERKYKELVRYSGDIAGYFFPGKVLKLLGPALGKIGDGHWGVVGSEIFIGYSVLALVIVAAIYYLRRGAGFWLSSALIFWLISLGPRLKVAGRVLFPLPYELLMKLGPIAYLDRAPCRYFVLTLLCFSVAAAFGAKAISAEGKRRWAYYVIAAFILIEFFQAPLDMRAIEFPDLYRRMRRDPEYYAVLDLPMEAPFAQRYARLYQTMHQKPIIHFIIPRQRPRYDFFEDNRFFKDVFDPMPLIEHPDEAVLAANRDMLVKSKIKFVIIHEKLMDPIIYGLVNDLLLRHKPAEIIDEPTLRAFKFY